MERPEPDAASEDAMDSFLEKFQSQPYRGRFREERWEEVGGPWAPRTRGRMVRAPASLSPRALALPADGWFLLSVRSRPRGSS